MIANDKNLDHLCRDLQFCFSCPDWNFRRRLHGFVLGKVDMETSLFGDADLGFSSPESTMDGNRETRITTELRQAAAEFTKQVQSYHL
ncbi:hypothetical protein [Amycolatopsis sp.]|uniref:hypothetical protein n=1 Tax=Amycolatopsis sp. TaxID=37632 RepID=UPI002BD7C8FF|nr:hypothetical protein [Amycolatopsis sp.]HVV12384.1 hypothetical protein [Amycolatopsis sp.]